VAADTAERAELISGNNPAEKELLEKPHKKEKNSSRFSNRFFPKDWPA
jgi:hypothetical protein